MKKNRIIQLFLVISAVALFFFTYYSGDKDQVVEFDDGITTGDKAKLSEETTSVIENVIYVGTANRGTFFDLNADFAEVYNDKPNLSNMKIVNAVISVRDGRKIYIKSDYAIYNRLTNDTKFTGNVLITESDNIIKSDNLDLDMSKNLISVYNNVEYNGNEGFLIADKVDIDILKNEAEIFMFKKKDKVQVKYKN